MLQTASTKHDASPSMQNVGSRRMDMMATLKIQSHSARFFDKAYEKFDAKLCNGKILDNHASFMGEFAVAVDSEVSSFNAKLDDSGYNQVLSIRDV